jgi:hypothetical protein
VLNPAPPAWALRRPLVPHADDERAQWGIRW